jgi:hypothetical protein
MFGGIKMVQSWAMGSTTTAKPAVHRKAAYSVHITGKDKISSGWHLARILFFAAAFVILFAGFTFMRTFASQDHIEPASASEHVISVDTGDTLWTLAAAVKSPSMDTRDAVHQLMKRNGLTSSSLESGQTLIVSDNSSR